MRIENFLKMAVFVAVFLHSSIANAQNNKKVISTGDSLLNSFENSIYKQVYNPPFWSKAYMPTFTILKIDIDANGKATSSKFSDSADTLFVKTFWKMSNYQTYLSTLEQYVKLRDYKDVSLLIPINYEPSYSSRRNFYYDNAEAFMKFNKKDFTGKAIVLPSINIKVLASGNM